MQHQTTAEPTASIPSWEALEEFARQGVQQLLQRILEEEVTELLGRQRCERRQGVDAPRGYRDGYGKRRQLTLSNGTITVHRVRVRGLEERFINPCSCRVHPWPFSGPSVP
jgi:transposase-like protein